MAEERLGKERRRVAGRLTEDGAGGSSGVELLCAQHDPLQRDSLQLGDLLERQLLKAFRGDEVEGVAATDAPRPTAALLEVRPRAEGLDEPLEPPRGIVPARSAHGGTRWYMLGCCTARSGMGKGAWRVCGPCSTCSP